MIATPEDCDLLIKNVQIATMDSERPESSYGVISDGVVAIKNGLIHQLGSAAELPELNPVNVIDGQQQWLLPGFIDCHTHLILCRRSFQRI